MDETSPLEVGAARPDVQLLQDELVNINIRDTYEIHTEYMMDSCSIHSTCSTEFIFLLPSFFFFNHKAVFKELQKLCHECHLDEAQLKQIIGSSYEDADQDTMETDEGNEIGAQVVADADVALVETNSFQILEAYAKEVTRYGR